MLNYLSPFIKNMAGETEMLRQLLKKSTDWQWTANHEKTFCRLKQLICQVPVLSHFNVHDPIVLQSDASSSAVAAVLLQNQHPVYYASKTLTDSQQKMAQIEKELYSIVFACIKFHQFIYGQTVTVETDHAPLITLFKKPLVEVPTRLQRMMLKIQLYSLNVVYKKGSEMYIADTLSRAALPETRSDGFIGRRNRQHILKPPQSPQTVSQDVLQKSPNMNTSKSHAVAPSSKEHTSPVEMRTRCGRIIRPPRRLNL